jgi:hypothetical protein
MCNITTRISLTSIRFLLLLEPTLLGEAANNVGA